MSAYPTAREPGRREGAREIVAGLLASIALFACLVGLVYRPVRLIPFAIVLALVAARMTERQGRLAGFAVAAGVVCWTLGMTIAVLTENPLY